jgi:SAM-dependent methyltransferase
MTKSFKEWFGRMRGAAAGLSWRKIAPRRAKSEKRPPQRQKSPLYQVALATEQELWNVKLAHRPRSFWYPYPTLKNLKPLEQLLAPIGFDMLELCRGPHGRIADIGAADGDLAFFLEKQGFAVDAIDLESANFNQMEGIRILKAALNSAVHVCSVDLDSQFALPNEKYDAIFLLGILYHLKNPFFVLEKLARATRHCFLGTRVARRAPDGMFLDEYPIAYLLEPAECNNDSTNFWIFSSQGLKRLIERTGWKLLAYTTIGDVRDSTPAGADHDERAFCLLESNW